MIRSLLHIPAGVEGRVGITGAIITPDIEAKPIDILIAWIPGEFIELHDLPIDRALLDIICRRVGVPDKRDVSDFFLAKDIDDAVKRGDIRARVVIIPDPIELVADAQKNILW